jgi:PadR family transcriptional regulator, regulatory protein PadR
LQCKEPEYVTLTGYLTQLLKGNTDVLILSLLEREPMYGHQIMDELERSSAGFLKVSEGTLYPALHRLVRNGLVRGRWSKLPSGKERKFYVMTPKGERELAACRSTWGEFAVAMGQITGTSAT